MVSVVRVPFLNRLADVWIGLEMTVCGPIFLLRMQSSKSSND